MEHLLHTPGFTLDFVEYVVVDEADRLLSQVVKRCSKDLLLSYCLTALLLFIRLALPWILLST